MSALSFDLSQIETQLHCSQSEQAQKWQRPSRCIPRAAILRTSPNSPSYPKEPFKSLEQTKEWLSSKIFNVGPDDVIGRSFNYAIVEKSISDPEEQVIGYVSVNALVPSPEIGYSLLPKFWNKGYATEALNLLLKMWWDLPRRSSSDLIGSIEDVERIYAICEKDNPGSCKVLKKCGFEIVKEIRFGIDELYLWALERQ